MTDHQYIFQGPINQMQLSHCTVYVQGMVQKLTLEDCNVQVSGIVNQRYDMEKRVVIAEPKKTGIEIELSEKRRENSNLRWQVQNLQSETYRLKQENKKLREAAKQPAEVPSDDVLVRRITHLQNELDKEKSAHKKEVDDLKYQYNTALKELNTYNQWHYESVRYEQNLDINDEMFDVLFTFINLFPFTTDGDLAFEFGITKEQVRNIASILKMVKSPEARREAVDYLHRQHRELIERRGGDQGNYAFAKPVEKVGKYGRLIKSYDSIKDAASDNGLCAETIRNHCQDYHKPNKTFTKEGYTFRFKKQ